MSAQFRRALWIALLINAAMFVVELAAGWRAGSVSLLADAVDFLGDAGNYALSLFVLSLAVYWRSRAALVKGNEGGAPNNCSNGPSYLVLEVQPVLSHPPLAEGGDVALANHRAPIAAQISLAALTHLSDISAIRLSTTIAGGQQRYAYLHTLRLRI